MSTDPVAHQGRIDCDIQAALDAGVAIADPQLLTEGEIYSVVIPAGGRVETLDTERYADRPRRATGCYRPATVDALITVIKRFQESTEPTIWVDQSGRIVAIFNDTGGQGTAAWRDHGAVLELEKTDEWEHWLSQDGNLLSQVAFAEHVEDGLTEIADPPGADMLELAQSIQATQGAQFRSAIRLQDGTIQAQYDEDMQATAGKSGQMTIPSEFKLAIAPFLGESPYALTARLRYRLSSGQLKIGYRIERPDAVIRDTLNGIATRLVAEFPAATVIAGKPAALPSGARPCP